MKQFPKSIKYKKNHKVNDKFLTLSEKKRVLPFFGNIALQSIVAGKLTYKQIEACRRTVKRGLNKKGNYWIRVYPYRPVTKKPLATRMGKGKGETSSWIAPIWKGQILFEISGINFDQASFILENAKSKLPLKTKIIKLIY